MIQPKTPVTIKMKKLILKEVTFTKEGMNVIYEVPSFEAKVGEMLESPPLTRMNYSHFEFFGFRVICWPLGKDEANSGVFCVFIAVRDIADFSCQIDVLHGSNSYGGSVNYSCEKHSKIIKVGEWKIPETWFHSFDDDCLVFPEGELLISIKTRKIDLPIIGSQEQKLLKDLYNIIDDINSCDINIVVNGTTIPVHRCILSARSPVFKAMLNSNMKESREKEIIIDDLSESTIREMILYLYTSKTPNLEKYAAELVVAAEKYGLDDLKEACERQLLKIVSNQNVSSLFPLADMYNLRKLKSACSFVICKNLNSVLKSENFDEMFFSKPTLMKDLLTTLATFLSDL